MKNKDRIPTLEEIVDALITLRITTDSLLTQVQKEIERDDMSEARSWLAFVDLLIESRVAHRESE